MKGQWLNFNSDNYRKIESGKRTSIRFGIKPLFLGSCVLTDEGITKSSVIISKLEIVKYSDITYEHASRDGFSSVNELRAELSSIYGRDFEDKDVFTLVEFW